VLYALVLSELKYIICCAGLNVQKRGKVMTKISVLPGSCLGIYSLVADRSKDGVSVELGQGSSAAGSGPRPADY
jgi:hypothetical protein